MIESSSSHFALSRRSLLRSAASGSAALLLSSRRASALDLPKGLAGNTAQTSSIVAAYYDSGIIPASSLINHHGSSASLFSYMAGSGWNANAPAMLQQMLQRDPTIPFNTNQYLQVGSQQTGIPLHRDLFNLVPIPSANDIINAVGGDMGSIQVTFSDTILWMLDTQRVSHHLRDQIYNRNRALRQILLRGISPEAHLVKVMNVGNLLTAAGVLAGAAAVFIAAAVAAPLVLGVGAFVTVTAATLYFAGVALGAAAATFAIFGIMDSLTSQGYGGNAPYSECLLNPCQLSG